MPDSDYEQLYKNLLVEYTQLKAMLEQMQKNMQAALEGNNELRQQLKEVQEKLDALLAKKKNRDRKDFGQKNEGRNPRPAVAATNDRRQRNADPFDGNTEEHELPREVVEHQVPDEQKVCPHCEVETQVVGSTVTAQLESLLHSLKWVDHHQETRACPKCKLYITKATKPTQPIPGSYAGPGLLARIVTNKVEDGLPNYRQEKMFARELLPIPRSTQCDWFIAMSITVEPLYELVKREILKSTIIQTDETQIKVQDRAHKKNMRKGKMFVCRGDKLHKLVCFVYSKELSFAENKKFFKGFTGVIQADAAPGFDALFCDQCATEAGCNAHSRRRIFDARAMDIIVADAMLDIYDELYILERRAKSLSDETRLALRRRYSKPLMKQLRQFHVQNMKTFSPSHLLHEAASYALKHWKALTRFLKNPQIEIDNNASEREIKSFVIARKNFLFAGSDAGAKALAIHTSLIASAKRNGLNPIEYLTDVFRRINDMKTSEIHQLLPDRWEPIRN